MVLPRTLWVLVAAAAGGLGGLLCADAARGRRRRTGGGRLADERETRRRARLLRRRAALVEAWCGVAPAAGVPGRFPTLPLGGGIVGRPRRLRTDRRNRPPDRAGPRLAAAAVRHLRRPGNARRVHGAPCQGERLVRGAPGAPRLRHPPTAAARPGTTATGTGTDRSARRRGVGGADPDAPYAAGRSPKILKVKSSADAEAVVVRQLPGKGRLAGMMWALLVELADGTRFRIGTGFSDAERRNPPAPGTVITFPYRGTYASGIPKFPSFVRVRADAGL